MLLPNVETGGFEFDAEGVLVDLLEEAVAEAVGDYEGAADDLPGQGVQHGLAALNRRRGVDRR